MQHALLRRVDGATLMRDRWLTAADLTIDVAWRITATYDVAANVGTEIAGGPTTITVGGTSVDHIPVVRVVGGLGVRARL
jgi:hypothetical protein